jgi:hypothetical protein
MSPAGRNKDRQRRRRRAGCSKTQFENEMAPMSRTLVYINVGNPPLDRMPQQHQLALVFMDSF